MQPSSLSLSAVRIWRSTLMVLLPGSTSPQAMSYYSEALCLCAGSPLSVHLKLECKAIHVFPSTPLKGAFAHCEEPKKHNIARAILSPWSSNAQKKKEIWKVQSLIRCPKMEKKMLTWVAETDSPGNTHEVKHYKELVSECSPLPNL